jgi:hypothetical protein
MNQTRCTMIEAEQDTGAETPLRGLDPPIR